MSDVEPSGAPAKQQPAAPDKALIQRRRELDIVLGGRVSLEAHRYMPGPAVCRRRQITAPCGRAGLPTSTHESIIPSL